MAAPGEITVELMQQILRQVEKDDTIEVLPCLNVKLDDSIHAGSCLSRVTVKYTRHGDTSQHSMSLIIKSLVKGDSSICSLQQSTLFPREIQMYDEILPRMSTLLSRALAGRHTDLYPRGYYTSKNPSFLVAVEDLTPKGFKPPKRKDGLDLKQCLLALRALARFHAASVIIQREDERLFTLFDQHYIEANSEEMKMTIPSLMSMVTKKMKSRPEFDPSWADRLQTRCSTMLEDMEAIRKRNDDNFNVLIHGDFSIHNLMYHYSETSGQADAVVLIDFQTCSYGSPVIDLHQLIYTSANDFVRASHIDTLLREYHAELTTTLVALGTARQDIISLPQLLTEFDRVMPYGLFFATCLLPVVSFDPDSAHAVPTEDLVNATTDGMHTMEPLLTDAYLKSLGIILPKFIQKNVF